MPLIKTAPKVLPSEGNWNRMERDLCIYYVGEKVKKKFLPPFFLIYKGSFLKILENTEEGKEENKSHCLSGYLGSAPFTPCDIYISYTYRCFKNGNIHYKLPCNLPFFHLKICIHFFPHTSPIAFTRKEFSWSLSHRVSHIH